MRSPWLLVITFAVACAHGPSRPTVTGPTLEMALDDGRASERPNTPQKTFEILMKLDPQLAAFTPRRLRFLLAEAGQLVFTVYRTTPEGNPGEALTTLSHTYEPTWVSSGKDGKWIVEELTVPPQRAPVWIGIHSPAGGGDPRVWASSNDTGNVFQRDADPSVPLSECKIRRTPMVRVELTPDS